MVELRKCPFCGCTANVWEENGQPCHKYVACLHCGVRTPICKTEGIAASIWNRRHPESDKCTKTYASL